MTRKEFKVGDRVVMGQDMFSTLRSAIPLDQGSRKFHDELKVPTVHRVTEVTYKHLDPRDAWVSGPPAQKVHLDPPIFPESEAWILSSWLDLAE